MWLLLADQGSLARPKEAKPGPRSVEMRERESMSNLLSVIHVSICGDAFRTFVWAGRARVHKSWGLKCPWI
jgi:hypothetical protein